MTKNTLRDLNDHLFMQMERLNDEDLNKDELNTEIHRSRAVAQVANQIVNNGKLVLEARRFKDDKNDINEETPRMLEG